MFYGLFPTDRFRDLLGRSMFSCGRLEVNIMLLRKAVISIEFRVRIPSLFE